MLDTKLQTSKNRFIWYANEKINYIELLIQYFYNSGKNNNGSKSDYVTSTVGKSILITTKTELKNLISKIQRSQNTKELIEIFIQMDKYINDLNTILSNFNIPNINFEFNKQLLRIC